MKSRMSLGRQKSCDIHFDDLRCSRVQALVTLTPSGAILEAHGRNPVWFAARTSKQREHDFVQLDKGILQPLKKGATSITCEVSRLCVRRR